MHNLLMQQTAPQFPFGTEAASTLSVQFGTTCS